MKRQLARLKQFLRRWRRRAYPRRVPCDITDLHLVWMCGPVPLSVILGQRIHATGKSKRGWVVRQRTLHGDIIYRDLRWYLSFRRAVKIIRTQGHPALRSTQPSSS